MFYVYYLKSHSYLGKSYIGFTKNLQQRLSDHNKGKSEYTKEYRPWIVVGAFIFDQAEKALRFERYLKSNAGRIFLRRYVADDIPDSDSSACQSFKIMND